MIYKIDHIGIVVKDFRNALAAFLAMGLQIKHTETAGDPWYADLAFIPVGETDIELLRPTSKDRGKIAKSIEERGEGVHHIALRVDNLVNIMSQLKELDLMPKDEIPQFGSRGTKITFFQPNFMGDISVELVEYPPKS